MKARYKTHMGDDLLVVDAARVSFAKESWYEDKDYLPKNKEHKRYKDWLAYRHKQVALGDGGKILSLGDYSLINFLAEHAHWTPAAHPQITLVMKAPVPIRTQCFKHKQGFVENEESRRYIKGVPSIYIPDTFRLAPENAKQGSGGEHPRSEWWRGRYQEHCDTAVSNYLSMVRDGVCPEQARFILPQGAEVEWYWTGSLAAFARVVKQRSDPHAQKEIQDLAKEIDALIQPLYPVAWEAFSK